MPLVAGSGGHRFNDFSVKIPIIIRGSPLGVGN